MKLTQETTTLIYEAGSAIKKSLDLFKIAYLRACIEIGGGDDWAGGNVNIIFRQVDKAVMFLLVPNFGTEGSIRSYCYAMRCALLLDIPMNLAKSCKMPILLRAKEIEKDLPADIVGKEERTKAAIKLAKKEDCDAKQEQIANLDSGYKLPDRGMFPDNESFSNAVVAVIREYVESNADSFTSTTDNTMELILSVVRNTQKAIA